jgi:hypothetical protein
MPKGNKVDKIEMEKRLRIVQEWIIDDHPYMDIVSSIRKQWEVSEPQAKRYIKAARDKWAGEEQAIIEQKRRARIESLKKLRRSLKDQYKGTPFGIRAILSVDKEISKLENLYPAIKLEHSGPGGKPIETVTSVSLTSKEIKKFAEELEQEV